MSAYKGKSVRNKSDLRREQKNIIKFNEEQKKIKNNPFMDLPQDIQEQLTKQIINK